MNVARAILALAAAALAPAVGRAQKGQVVLDDGAYATTQAARAAWRPIEKGTPPVEAVTAAGRRVLKLPCNFATNAEGRVAWDRRGQWNLAACREVAMQVAAGHGRGARMVVYLRSGKGWYGCPVDVRRGAGGVRLARKDFKSEGQPLGWDRIDGVRLSVLRDRPADGAVLVWGLRAELAAARVLIYRNDAGAGQEGGVGRYARLAADALDRLGIEYELADDRGVASGRLAGKKVAILPLNPVLPKEAAQALRQFVAAGGKLLVCYRLPEPLGELLGVRSAGHVEDDQQQLAAIVFQGREDRPKIKAAQHSWIARKIVPAPGTKVVGHWADRAGKLSDLPAVTRNNNGYFVGHVLTRHALSAKDRLLLEMLGELWRDAWKAAYDHRVERLGRVAGVKGVEELWALADAAGPAGAAEKLKDALRRGDRLTGDARAAMQYGDAIVAAELGEQAQDAYLRGYAAHVRPRPGEFRAVWCHSPAGVRDRTWDQAAKALADAGFNAVLPNMCWGDAAAYRSKVLPPAPVVAESGDQLALCLAAAKRHGLAVHVWRVNWRFWNKGPETFRKEMLQAGRVQRDHRGRTLGWLCPSHPANRQLELEAMLEIARTDGVAGIHFDYIRYPGLHGCYCPGCRRRFEAAFGLKVENWPADVRTGKLKQKYLQFRRDNITALVAAVSEQARKIAPDILISAAVFWHWPSARDGVGQDWKLWVEKGYLDFVCPMQYTRDHESFDDRTRRTLAWAGGRAPVMPGIGATLGLTPDGTLRQVLTARKHGAGGFVLFNYDPTLTDEHLPLLRLGATAEKTRWRPGRRDTMPAGS